jgi:glutamine amidotransferase
MDKQICILDYGSGNVTSVKNALDRLKITNVVSNDVLAIDKATHLILPGVGAFSASMDKIEALLPIDNIRKQISKGKPFMGICVGMQVLAENGQEFQPRRGLNMFPGTNVIALPDNVPTPHVGWNSIKIVQNHEILRGLQEDADFYFVHSYQVAEIAAEYIVATCDYGLEFPAVIAKENLIGIQFHPEKSQRNGDLVLRNYVETFS